MSSNACPKQFLPLTGDQTMLQMTVLRTLGHDGFTDPLIVANGAHTQIGRAHV